MVKYGIMVHRQKNTGDGDFGLFLAKCFSTHIILNIIKVLLKSVNIPQYLKLYTCLSVLDEKHFQIMDR